MLLGMRFLRGTGWQQVGRSWLFVLSVGVRFTAVTLTFDREWRRRRETRGIESRFHSGGRQQEVDRDRRCYSILQYTVHRIQLSSA